MAKKPKKNAKDTLFGFVAYLYRNDPLISNHKAITAIKKKFPAWNPAKESAAHRLSAIRSRLRQKGLRIPYQRENVGKFFRQKYIKGTSIPAFGENKDG